MSVRIRRCLPATQPKWTWGLIAVSCVFGACAGPAASSNVVTGTAMRGHDEALAKLKRDLATQERRADELEARVALLESEARTARAGRNGKITETVVIGGHREQPSSELDSDDELTSASNEEPPLKLRLHGTAPSRPAPHLEEPLPLPLPSSTERLPVVPLPAHAAREASAEETAAVSFTEQYAGALRLLRARKYQAAKDAFSKLLHHFSGHQGEDRVTYWLGEASYALREYGEAAGHFEKLVNDFPASEKVPDALLKAGLCYRHLGAASDAERYMARVRRDYPDSQAARLASAEGIR